MFIEFDKWINQKKEKYISKKDLYLYIDKLTGHCKDQKVRINNTQSRGWKYISLNNNRRNEL